MDHTENCQPQGIVKWFLSWRGVALTIVLAAISYYLFTMHLQHLAIALPYLILLACPLMHIFGHGSDKHGKKDNKNE